MKVHLVKQHSIEDYISRNARSRTSFETFSSLIKGADWEEPKDIIATFSSADILGNSSSRVVFNVGGNSYRVICKYVFGKKRAHLFICWIGTHAKYTSICSRNEQYTINSY